MMLNDDPRIKKLLPFTYHRMKIGDYLFTTSEEKGEDMSKSFQFDAFLRKNGGTLNGKRVLDLGCLEGGYTIACAMNGAKEAVGVEIRQVSIERCNLVKELLNVNNANFVQQNAKDIDKAELGIFDGIILSGLLYHMNDPYSFLGRCYDIIKSDGIILIDTHVALPQIFGHECSPDITEVNIGSKKYRGRWAFEYEENASQEQIETFLWASYGNHQAFWPLEESLLRMLSDTGFREVEKVERPPYSSECQEGHKNCRVTFIVKK